MNNFAIDIEQLDSEPVHSLTNEELTMMRYFMNQVVNNIKLDASDMDDQVFRDNGNILIQFSRDRMEDVRSLMDKLNK